MNPFREFKDHILETLAALVDEGVLPKGLDFSRVVVEPPRDPAHGDIATKDASRQST